MEVLGTGQYKLTNDAGNFFVSNLETGKVNIGGVNFAVAKDPISGVVRLEEEPLTSGFLPDKVVIDASTSAAGIRNVTFHVYNTTKGGTMT